MKGVEILDETEVPNEISEEIKQRAAAKAEERARIARWDLNIAVFLFAVLIIVIILLFQGFELEVVAPIAVFGLCMVWFVGWRRGRQLYHGFYKEELARLEQELAKREQGLTKREQGLAKRERGLAKRERKVEETIEETIEEKVQKALRERWR